MNDLGPLPGQLVEAGNGMMLVLFLAVAISAGIYIYRQLRRVVAKFGHVGVQDLFRIAYPELKAAWSVAVLFSGLFVRTLDVWLVRHIENHGEVPGGVVAALATPVLILTTFPIAWGAICWMRTVMPLRCHGRPRLDRLLRYAWGVLAIAAIAFGVWMAL